MHDLVFHLCAAWLIALVVICVVRAATTASLATRVLLVDLLTLILAGVLLLNSVDREVVHFADAALILVLLSFAATLAASRFLRRGKVF